MSATLFKICGIAIISAMLTVLLRKWGADLSVLVKIASGIVLASLCFSAVAPIVEYVKELAAINEGSGLSESVEFMLQVLAVAIVTHICATVCRDCGETTVASYVELGGKGEILLLSLPMVKRIIDLAVEML